MPNAFAYLVLFSWPLVAVVLFAAQPPARALSMAVIVGYLLLPERASVDFPMIPTIDKQMMINLTAAIVTYLAQGRERKIASTTPIKPTLGRTRWIFYTLIALTLAIPFLTVLSNGEPVVAGPTYIQGLRFYDAFSMIANAGVIIVPFVLGMFVLGTPTAQAELLRVLVISACAYAFLVLFEVRMSPNLNIWVYGYFPHDWIQHLRGGGFRPVVFLNHGLWLGIFLCMAVLGACTLSRNLLTEPMQKAPWLAATVWLTATLLLSRNMGATALAVFFAPLVLFASPRLQILIAVTCASLLLMFPMLRGAGLVPIEFIHELAQYFSEERAASLQFRLDQEDALLARANEKPLAGWGSWGRNRVYDPETGQDLSVTDGLWVMTVGYSGWLGYIGQFGLLAGPLILAARLRNGMIPRTTAGISVLLAAALTDLIPNATVTPVTWIVSGALAGQSFRQTSVLNVSKLDETFGQPHLREPAAGRNKKSAAIQAGFRPTGKADDARRHVRTSRI